MCVLSIKVPIRKKSGYLPYAPPIYSGVYVLEKDKNKSEKYYNSVNTFVLVDK